MRPIRHGLISTVLAWAILAPGSTAAAWAQEAEEERELGWSGSAELTFVDTTGNAEAQTLGFRAALQRLYEVGTLSFAAGGLRAETTTISRFAVGTPVDFMERENKVSDVTAENYFLRGRYDHPISERLFWYAGAGWERNEFAGIANRYSAVGGVGHIWFDDDKARFRTDYGLTYTIQDDVVDNPAVDDSFLGARVGWDYFRQLTGSTSYGNVLFVDVNLDETSDWRADMTNWLAVAMSERLALKLSWQLLYDAEPSFVALPLLGPDGLLTGETVLGQLDELDSVFTAALVVTF